MTKVWMRIGLLSLALGCSEEPEAQRSTRDFGLRPSEQTREFDTAAEDSDTAEDTDGDTGEAEPGPEETLTIPSEVPVSGYGTLSGDCGQLWLTNAQGDFTGGLLRNSLDVTADGFEVTDLTADGQTVATSDNLGGSSLLSEGISMEVLVRCELADLVKTEAEITYDSEGSRTDILTEINEVSTGVSVTRAFNWNGSAYTDANARDLLIGDRDDGKLQGAADAQTNASAEDEWSQNVLHILAIDSQTADQVEATYNSLSTDQKGSVLVLLTVTDGCDAQIYNQSGCE